MDIHRSTIDGMTLLFNDSWRSYESYGFQQAINYSEWELCHSKQIQDNFYYWETPKFKKMNHKY